MEKNKTVSGNKSSDNGEEDIYFKYKKAFLIAVLAVAAVVTACLCYVTVVNMINNKSYDEKGFTVIENPISSVSTAETETAKDTSQSIVTEYSETESDDSEDNDDIYYGSRDSYGGEEAETKTTLSNQKVDSYVKNQYEQNKQKIIDDAEDDLLLDENGNPVTEIK